MDRATAVATSRRREGDEGSATRVGEGNSVIDKETQRDKVKGRLGDRGRKRKEGKEL